MSWSNEYANDDIILVWYCDNCSLYDFNFHLNKLYCSHCGKLMNKTRYKKIEKVLDKEKTERKE
jgi:ribosomal protein L37E